MQKVLEESKDAEVSSHYTGGNGYGDSNAEIYTSVNAKYLSTDYLVAQTAKDYGTTLDNNREEVSAQVLSHLQNLLFICACGGCMGFTLFLLLWNLITLAARYECRKYGILQAIGMSKKQMRVEILKKGVVTGICSLFLAFFFYGCYFVIKEWLKVRYVVENFGDNYTLKEGMASTYYYLETCGVSLGKIILFAVSILTFFLILFYWCNQFLIRCSIDGKAKTIMKGGFSMGTILSAKNIYKTYKTSSGDVLALRGVSLEVEKGLFYAIIGKSGSENHTFTYFKWT